MIRGFWLEEEDDYLREVAGTMPARQIARLLRRTENSVRARASKIGVDLVAPPAEPLSAAERRVVHTGMDLFPDAGRLLSSLYGGMARALSSPARSGGEGSSGPGPFSSPTPFSS